MKCLLCGLCVAAFGLGACRPPPDAATILSAKETISSTGTVVPNVSKQVIAPTDALAATEATSANEATASPASIFTPAPTDKPTTLNPTGTPSVLLGTGYELELAADGFQKPIYLTHASDGSGRLFVVEQAGVIWTLQYGKIISPAFLDISDRVGCCALEQGLLGMAFHPDHRRNGYVFVHYSDLNGDTVVQRFVMSTDLNQADPRGDAIVLTHTQPYRNHNGGQISFGPDGYLYIGLGDGGKAGDPHDNGQNPLTWLGAILRVDVDHPQGFAVPPDNPFLQNGYGAPEIWVYGLRNPWRFSFDRLTGDLYIGDVGQNNWEEIDFQPAGSAGAENYGWSRMEGSHCYKAGCDYDASVAPITEYHHSDGGCSVTGGYVYRGENLKSLQGSYVYGDYCSGLIWALLQTAVGEWTNTQIIESGLKISSFGEDEAGELYVVDHGGGVFRLMHALSL